MQSYSTLAALSAGPGPATSDQAYVAEVDGIYNFVSGDATTADGWAVVTPTGGTPGRWRLQSDRVAISPLGGGADDWPRLIAGACASMSAYGKAVVLNAGDWICRSVQPLPVNGIDIYGNPGVRIVSQLTVGAPNPENAPFLALSGATPSLTTTVAASNSPGTSTLSSTDSISAGSIFRVYDNVSGSGFQGSTYVVRSVTGNGPYTIKVDRPIIPQFGAGDKIEVLPVIPSNIRIFGGGMVVTGTCDRYLEIIGSRNCLVENVRFLCNYGTYGGSAVGSANDIMSSFDTFGFSNEFRLCEWDGAGAAATGVALETQDGSRIVRCKAHHVTGVGIVVFDSYNPMVENCEAYENAFGVVLTADANVKGCVDAIVRGGRYEHNSVSGVEVNNGSFNSWIETVSRYNAINAMIGDPSSVTAGTHITGDFSNATGTAAISISSTVKDVYFHNIDCSNSSLAFNIGTGVEVDISGFTYRGNATSGRVIQSLGSVRARGLIIEATNAVNAILIQGGRFDCEGAYITGGNTSNLFSVSGGLLTISQAKGAVTSGTGLYQSGSGVIEVGVSVDMSSCTTPVLGASIYTRTFLGPVKVPVYTVATLPAAATVGVGARAFVTDANATTYASVVASGGANGVPVYSDGTNWRIG